ncbi:SDR family oxidoreductase [Mesonia ostreae]|uniref:SDR family oxidoreductase n=1 Tax=Mesonia ostreae TaxID=861110 RepID=A0ABU2KEH2_9FLAO|nr:SDR family oxidoreductase [Mesonia ostreae]MDT0293103.1 SDR family oxidoreductase [Mesonia ostreae]
MKINNKVIVITGANGGIGSAIARKLDREGCFLVLTARRKESLTELKKDLKNNHLEVEMDVTNNKSVLDAFTTILNNVETIDVLVNVAGVMPLTYLKNLHLDEWLNTIEVNVKGILRTLHGALPIMKKQKKGHIVNIASVDGKELYKGGAVYGASKAAIIALSRAMRMELSPNFNIKVTSIEPGTVDTSLREDITDTELLNDKDYGGDEPMLDPEDIARAVLYVISEPHQSNINQLTIKPTGKS